MKVILIEKFPRIVRNKKSLGAKLGVRINSRGKEVTIEGTAINEHAAEKVIEAIDFGFSLSTALLIKEKDFTFEVINIKDHTRRKDLELIRGRLIGTQGKTLKTLHDLTNCNFEMKDNEVGIIGNPEDIENAQNAVISIIKGSKQSNVYNLLEKNHPEAIDDWGLK
jgi:ribosomal RNA assembly protein